MLAGGLEAAKTWIREMIELQQQMIDAVGPVAKMEPPLVVDYSDEILGAVRDGALDRIAATQQIADKAERQEAEAAVAAEIAAEMQARFGDDPAVAKQVKSAVRSVTKEVVRKRIVSEGIRIDGRATNQLRPLMSRVGVIPTAHGLRTVPAGRYPGAQLHHIGHRPQRHDDRRPVAHRQEALLPPLQLPAVLHRRDRLHARAQAA